MTPNASIALGDRTIDFAEGGDPLGVPVLFVPGSFSTPVAWRGLQTALPEQLKFISTSIMGYGGTSETRSLEDCTIDHETAILEAVAERIGQAFHIVGHSFGGTIALAAVLRQRIKVQSIATFEANPIAVLKAQHPELFEAAQQVGRTIHEGYDDGDPNASAGVIDYWGGEGAFASLPEVVQDYCRATTFANVLDWRTVPSFQPTPAEWSTVQVPTLLVRGSQANPAMVQITGALKALLPNARDAVVEGAGHFLINTHPNECAELLAAFYREIGAVAPPA